MSELVASVVVGGSEGGPLVLAGPPGQLSGRIRLHNPGDAKVVLRDAGLTEPAGHLGLPPSRHALQPLVLRPNQSGSAPLTIAIDPTTPRGEYRAELELGGRSMPVVLQVAEVFKLTVVPTSLVVANHSGVAQKKWVIVANEGNVAFTLGESTSVDLYDDMRGADVLRVAIEPLLESDRPELEALVLALLAVARSESRALGSLEVRARDGQIEVRPGETKAVELELTLRDDLPRNRRYRGQLPVLTRDVDILVVASNPPASVRAPRRTRPRATQKAESPPREGRKS